MFYRIQILHIGSFNTNLQLPSELLLDQTKQSTQNKYLKRVFRWQIFTMILMTTIAFSTSTPLQVWAMMLGIQMRLLVGVTYLAKVRIWKIKMSSNLCNSGHGKDPPELEM